jgi:alkanesulfonate monooxygenase SsuD/methylene tetrahydromethanopterin reductase-like flavin-dependent oxidoreductase (luciferase family)
MPRVQFGYFLHPGPMQQTAAARSAYATHLAAALDCISGAFDSVWMMDHFSLAPWQVLEGWTTISYLAGRYPSLRFGPLVLSQSYRNPALLATMAATFQYLTGGRLILGLGAGWKEEEYRAYGYDFLPPGARVTQLEEALQIITALWRDERATVAGRYYRVEAAPLGPKPDPPPPLLIGARQPRMLRLAARYADWWNDCWRPFAAYRDTVAELEAACAAVGRDPATLRKTLLTVVACAPTEAAARASLKAAVRVARQGSLLLPRVLANPVVGTPAQVVDQLQPFVELGVDYIIVTTPHFPDETTLTLLRDEVLPALNGLTGTSLSGGPVMSSRNLERAQRAGVAS